eukprot:TRINITY_DN11659_c0_g1_i1.p1 TRINITY_DN11659_c0_g1~~TRINITY_DN11659_c0_g1_i1.p1  ORF type:complete len:2705 (+),score=423.02 TRINITY_DN11659_c0_g1_i1:27-8117(+)
MASLEVCLLSALGQELLVEGAERGQADSAARFHKESGLVQGRGDDGEAPKPKAGRGKVKDKGKGKEKEKPRSAAAGKDGDGIVRDRPKETVHSTRRFAVDSLRDEFAKHAEASRVLHGWTVGKPALLAMLFRLLMVWGEAARIVWSRGEEPTTLPGLMRDPFAKPKNAASWLGTFATGSTNQKQMGWLGASTLGASTLGSTLGASTASGASVMTTGQNTLGAASKGGKYALPPDPHGLVPRITRVFHSIDHGNVGRITWDQFIGYLVTCGPYGSAADYEVVRTAPPTRVYRPFRLEHWLYGNSFRELRHIEACGGKSKLLSVGRAAGRVGLRHPTAADPTIPPSFAFEKQFQLETEEDKKKKSSALSLRSAPRIPGLVMNRAYGTRDVQKDIADRDGKKSRYKHLRPGFSTALDTENPESRIACGTYLDAFRLVVIGYTNGRLRMYDSETGEECEPAKEARHPRLPAAPSCLCYSQQLNILYIGMNDGSIATSEVTHRAGTLVSDVVVSNVTHVHSEQVTLISTAYVGGLFSASHDGRIFLLDHRSFEVLAEYTRHEKVSIVGLAFCSELSFLIAGGRAYLMMWLATVPGKPTMLTDMVSPHKGNVIGVACIAKSTWVVSADDHGLVKIWDAAHSKCLQTIDLVKDIPRSEAAFGGKAKVTSLALIPCQDERTRLIVGGDRRAWCYVHGHVPPQGLTDDKTIIAFGVSPFSRTVYTVSKGFVKSWCPQRGELLGSTALADATGDPVTCCELDPTGKVYFMGFSSGRLGVYNSSTYELIARREMADTVLQIVCSKSHTLVITAHELAMLISGEGKQSWNVVVVHSIPQQDPKMFSRLAVDYRGAILAAGFSTGYVFMFRLPQQVAEPWKSYSELKETDTGEVRCMQVIPFYSQNAVLQMEHRRRKSMMFSASGYDTKALAFLVAVGYSEGDVVLYDARPPPQRAQQVAEIKLMVGEDVSTAPTALVYDPQSHTLVIGSDIGVVEVHSVHYPEAPRLVKRFKAHTAPVTQLSIHRQGLVGSTGRDNTVKYWRWQQTLGRAQPACQLRQENMKGENLVKLQKLTDLAERHRLLHERFRKGSVRAGQSPRDASARSRRGSVMQQSPSFGHLLSPRSGRGAQMLHSPTSTGKRKHGGSARQRRKASLFIEKHTEREKEADTLASQKTPGRKDPTLTIALPQGAGGDDMSSEGSRSGSPARSAQSGSPCSPNLRRQSQLVEREDAARLNEFVASLGPVVNIACVPPVCFREPQTFVRRSGMRHWGAIKTVVADDASPPPDMVGIRKVLTKLVVRSWWLQDGADRDAPAGSASPRGTRSGKAGAGSPMSAHMPLPARLGASWSCTTSPFTWAGRGVRPWTQMSHFDVDLVEEYLGWGSAMRLYNPPKVLVPPLKSVDASEDAPLARRPSFLSQLSPKKRRASRKLSMSLVSPATLPITLTSPQESSLGSPAGAFGVVSENGGRKPVVVAGAAVTLAAAALQIDVGGGEDTPRRVMPQLSASTRRMLSPEAGGASAAPTPLRKSFFCDIAPLGSPKGGLHPASPLSLPLDASPESGALASPSGSPRLSANITPLDDGTHFAVVRQESAIDVLADGLRRTGDRQGRPRIIVPEGARDLKAFMGVLQGPEHEYPLLQGIGLPSPHRESHRKLKRALSGMVARSKSTLTVEAGSPSGSPTKLPLSMGSLSVSSRGDDSEGSADADDLSGLEGLTPDMGRRKPTSKALSNFFISPSGEDTHTMPTSGARPREAQLRVAGQSAEGATATSPPEGMSPSPSVGALSPPQLASLVRETSPAARSKSAALPTIALDPVPKPPSPCDAPPPPAPLPVTVTPPTGVVSPHTHTHTPRMEAEGDHPPYHSPTPSSLRSRTPSVTPPGPCIVTAPDHIGAAPPKSPRAHDPAGLAPHSAVRTGRLASTKVESRWKKMSTAVTAVGLQRRMKRPPSVSIPVEEQGEVPPAVEINTAPATKSYADIQDQMREQGMATAMVSAPAPASPLGKALAGAKSPRKRSQWMKLSGAVAMGSCVSTARKRSQGASPDQSRSRSPSVASAQANPGGMQLQQNVAAAAPQKKVSKWRRATTAVTVQTRFGRKGSDRKKDARKPSVSPPANNSRTGSLLAASPAESPRARRFSQVHGYGCISNTMKAALASPPQDALAVPGASRGVASPVTSPRLKKKSSWRSLSSVVAVGGGGMLSPKGKSPCASPRASPKAGHLSPSGDGRGLTKTSSMRKMLLTAGAISRLTVPQQGEPKLSETEREVALAVLGGFGKGIPDPEETPYLERGSPPPLLDYVSRKHRAMADPEHGSPKKLRKAQPPATLVTCPTLSPTKKDHSQDQHTTGKLVKPLGCPGVGSFAGLYVQREHTPAGLQRARKRSGLLHVIRGMTCETQLSRITNTRKLLTNGTGADDERNVSQALALSTPPGGPDLGAVLTTALAAAAVWVAVSGRFLGRRFVMPDPTMHDPRVHVKIEAFPRMQNKGDLRKHPVVIGRRADMLEDGTSPLTRKVRGMFSAKTILQKKLKEAKKQLASPASLAPSSPGTEFIQGTALLDSVVDAVASPAAEARQVVEHLALPKGAASPPLRPTSPVRVRMASLSATMPARCASAGGQGASSRGQSVPPRPRGSAPRPKPTRPPTGGVIPRHLNRAMRATPSPAAPTVALSPSDLLDRAAAHARIAGAGDIQKGLFTALAATAPPQVRARPWPPK